MRNIRSLLLSLAIVVGAIVYFIRRGHDEPPPAPAPPAAEPAPAPPPAPPPPPPSAPPPAGRPTEASEMARIRKAVDSAPAKALDLIAAADRAYPSGTFSEERASLRVDALVRIGEIGRARDEAEAYLVRYPHGAFADHLQQLTGVHPVPLPPVP